MRCKVNRRAVRIALQLPLAGALAFTGMAVLNAPASAQVPGLNGRIVFASDQLNENEEEFGDIFTMNPDGSDLQRLTDTPDVEDTEPQFSPDGTKIVWVQTPFEEDSTIWVMNADGTGEPRQLTGNDDPDNRDIDFAPTFSPNGTTIVFTRLLGDESFRADLFITNADGSGDVTNLTSTDDRSEEYPEFSPDGEMIAFANRDEGIAVMPATPGGTQTQITNNETDSEPTWSPDGSRIAFNRLMQGLADVFEMNATGGAVGNLTGTTDESETSPVYSPDGTQIVYDAGIPFTEGAGTERQDEAGVAQVAGDDREIVTADVDGSGALARTDNDMDDFDPHWQRLARPTDPVTPDPATPAPDGICELGGPVPAGYNLIIGTPGPDDIEGTEGPDLIRSLGGDDDVDGNGGDDIICTGDNDDESEGGKGDDLIFGEDGDDDLAGGNGEDRIFGGDETDKIVGGDNDDKLFGNDGTDTLKGKDGDDKLVGGEGKDELSGGKESDKLKGNSGADELDGGKADDKLNGGKGKDDLDGGKGDDKLNGGKGEDDLEQ